MVSVPAGKFKYGKENQLTMVEGFSIAQFPITNAQYKEYIDATNYSVPFTAEERAYPYSWDVQRRSYPEGKANHPVVLVTWDNAQAYCQWLSERMGRPFRLPTEVEWEKAARGIEGQLYPWPGVFKLTKRIQRSGINGTTPVGVYCDAVSPFGVLDCAGNVLEWTADKHEGGGIVLRGGSWIQDQIEAHCISRFRYFPYQRDIFIGFRVACEGIVATS